METGLPAWAQVGLAIAAVGSAVVGLVKFNIANLWRTVGGLQEEVKQLRAEIALLRQEKQDANRLANTYKMTILAREAEVNDLLDELDRPHKYVLVPLATSAGVGDSA
jgi:hypothetical protein